MCLLRGTDWVLTYNSDWSQTVPNKPWNVHSAVTLLHVSKTANSKYTLSNQHGCMATRIVCPSSLFETPAVRALCSRMSHKAKLLLSDIIKISDRWSYRTVQFTWRQTDCHTDWLLRTSLPAGSGLPRHCCAHTGSSHTAFCTTANCARQSEQLHKIQSPRHETFVPIFRIVSQQQVYWQSVHYLQRWLALSTVSQHRHVCFQHPLQWCNLATSRPGCVSCSHHRQSSPALRND